MAEVAADTGPSDNDEDDEIEEEEEDPDSLRMISLYGLGWDS